MSPGKEGREVLEGLVDKIVFQNQENGFSVVRVKTSENVEASLVGSLLGIQEGETIRAEGQWTTSKTYGSQFKVHRFQPLAPRNEKGIERYLGSGLLEGIGKELAKRLVERFGAETLDVIDKHPGRLTEVDGIGPKRRERIVRTWKEQRHVRDVMVFLQSHDVSVSHAAKIYKRYGDQAIGVVKASPYRLAIDVHGIGFRTADGIAKSLGLAEDSPDRAAAAALHVLREAQDEGHVFLPMPELVSRVEALTGIVEKVVGDAMQRLSLDGHIIFDRVDETVVAYLSKLFAAEKSAADALKRRARLAQGRVDLDVEKAISWFESTSKLVLADAQRDAVRRAIRAPSLVITGGPGTGKTTIVTAIIRIFDKKGLKIALAAPTGRAAKRLGEATGREAKTLHRLLEFNPQSGAFDRNDTQPLECDVLVIDETSMVDIEMFSNVLAALPAQARLILIGDVDQLPSVGAGSVLSDLIASKFIDVVRLTQIFRQAETSSIVLNAHKINSGEVPLPSPGADGDFFFIEKSDPAGILAVLQKLLTERIPSRFGLDPIDDVQVLTPMHRGDLGATHLNTLLQSWLNPAGKELQRGARTYRLLDKVMQTRNNYDLAVYNGDIGRVVRIEPDGPAITVRFDDRQVKFEAQQIDDLVPAYACSIHKSQGSEFSGVVIPLHTQHFLMLRRNLLYPAVTRGKRLVVIVGSKKALELSVASARVEHRHSALANRLGRE